MSENNGLYVGIHKAKDIVNKLGIIKTLLSDLKIPIDNRKVIYANIDKIKEILFEAKLKQDKNIGR